MKIQRFGTERVGLATPGPWSVDPQYPFSIMAADGDLEPWHVANAMEDCQGDEAISQANARLIAAAPDLLEALKRLADASATVGNLDHAGVTVPTDAWADMYSANNAARAAIAKAEGSAQ